jgi:hypothetical protein
MIWSNLYNLNIMLYLFSTCDHLNHFPHDNGLRHFFLVLTPVSQFWIDWFVVFDSMTNSPVCININAQVSAITTRSICTNWAIHFDFAFISEIIVMRLSINMFFKTI